MNFLFLSIILLTDQETDCIASFVCQYRNKLRIFVKESFNVHVFLHARKDSIMLPTFLLLFQQPIYLWNHKSCSMLRGRELHEFIVTHRWIRSSWLIFSNSQSGAREHTGPISYQKRIWGARLASFHGPYLK